MQSGYASCAHWLAAWSSPAKALFYAAHAIDLVNKHWIGGTGTTCTCINHQVSKHA